MVSHVWACACCVSVSIHELVHACVTAYACMGPRDRVVGMVSVICLTEEPLFASHMFLPSDDIPADSDTVGSFAEMSEDLPSDVEEVELPPEVGQAESDEDASPSYDDDLPSDDESQGLPEPYLPSERRI